MRASTLFSDRLNSLILAFFRPICEQLPLETCRRLLRPSVVCAFGFVFVPPPQFMPVNHVRREIGTELFQQNVANEEFL